MIPGDLLSAFPHRQFHTLPGLLDSWAALPNSNPNACVPMQGGSLYHFYDGLWYDPAERRTHDLPCERRTRYRLSQPGIGCHYSGLGESAILGAGLEPATGVTPVGCSNHCPNRAGVYSSSVRELTKSVFTTCEISVGSNRIRNFRNFSFFSQAFIDGILRQIVDVIKC